MTYAQKASWSPNLPRLPSLSIFEASLKAETIAEPLVTVVSTHSIILSIGRVTFPPAVIEKVKYIGAEIYGVAT